MKTNLKNIIANVLLIGFTALVLGCYTPPPSQQQQARPPARQQTPLPTQQQQPAQPRQQQQGNQTTTQQQQAQPASPFWTGNGGRGVRLGILVPQSQGLSENQGYLVDP